MGKLMIVVPTSGGKDSQATALWAEEKWGIENVTLVFCDTKWEHQTTYDHLSYFSNKIGQEIIYLTSKKYDGFLDLAIKKGRFPYSQVGFCTEELKIKPMIDWILKQKSNMIVFQGIRAQESPKRSKMSEYCQYFRFYFEPYKSNEMIVERYEESPPITLAQKKEFEKASKRLSEGKNDAKYFTYRKKDVVEWTSKYSCEIERPFFRATAEEVIRFSLERGYDIHPWYWLGASRIGCAPCKNENLRGMQFYMEEVPDVIEKVRDAEYVSGRTFFAPDKVPERYLSGISDKGEKIALIDDLIRYLQDKTAQTSLADEFPDFGGGCKSVFNICET